VTLETKRNAKIVCASLSGDGEYSGAKTEVVHLVLHGCEEPGVGACQNEDASSGEVALSALEGQLGVIAKSSSAGKPPSVGVALSPTGGRSQLAALYCGDLAHQVLVEGAVIAAETAVDKTSSTFSLKLAAKRGKQKPEAFEGGTPDVLLATFAGSDAERAGLTATASVTTEEPLEIKAID
jgi:hypothetical protein